MVEVVSFIHDGEPKLNDVADVAAAATAAAGATAAAALASGESRSSGAGVPLTPLPGGLAS